MDYSRSITINQIQRQIIQILAEHWPYFPLYYPLKQKLNKYNSLLKKIIREAKVKYYNSRLEESKSNMKKTWSVINEICKTKHHKKGIKAIILNGK